MSRSNLPTLVAATNNEQLGCGNVPLVNTDDRSPPAFGWLSERFVMRKLQTMFTLFDGNITHSIIFLTIAQASLSNGVTFVRSGSDFPGSEDMISPAPLRPISLEAVAETLRMSYETTRRNVRKLEELGYCKKVKYGTVVNLDTLNSPQFKAARLHDASIFRGLLKEIGWTSGGSQGRVAGL